MGKLDLCKPQGILWSFINIIAENDRFGFGFFKKISKGLESITTFLKCSKEGFVCFMVKSTFLFLSLLFQKPTRG